MSVTHSCAEASRAHWFLPAALLLPMLALASLAWGAGAVGPAALAAWFAGHADPESMRVLTELRLPRMLAAVLVGAALGTAGALLQSATRNPFAEPGLLGVNAGAALGVVVGITWAGAAPGMDYLVWALTGAACGTALVLAIVHLDERADAPLRLILAGVALGASFSGLTSALLLAQQSGFDQYRFWVMGSLAGVPREGLVTLAPIILVALIAGVALARPLGALRLGDEAAKALGVSPSLVRGMVIAATTVLVGGAVALAGPIAFVGLVAPALARALGGAQLAVQIFASAWLGACLTLTADIVARQLHPPFETPASVPMALLGAPLMIWLTRAQRIA